MTRRKALQFSPNTLGGHRLEDRVVLSTVRPLAQVRSVHALNSSQARPPIDYSIPYVFAAPGGAPQFALNFTSNSYNQVLFGGGKVPGIQKILREFNDSGNLDQALHDLARLSKRVPFGLTDLLPIWQNSIELFAQTGETPDVTGGGPFKGPYHRLANQLRVDLINYLDSGVGVNFNVQLSKVRFSTDYDLIYNSKVGQIPVRQVMNT